MRRTSTSHRAPWLELRLWDRTRTLSHSPLLFTARLRSHTPGALLNTARLRSQLPGATLFSARLRSRLPGARFSSNHVSRWRIRRLSRSPRTSLRRPIGTTLTMTFCCFDCPLNSLATPLPFLWSRRDVHFSFEDGRKPVQSE
jgi:hypothetical protein